MVKWEKGFSLVEVIVAMAIIAGVTAFSVLLFSQSIGNIYYSGNISETIFEAQADIENNVSDYVEDPNSIPAPSYVAITIDFPDDGENEPIEMTATFFEVLYEHENRSDVLHYFIFD